MGWRIVYIENAAKLSLNLDCLQVKYMQRKYNINLDEISSVVIEDYKCVITARLLSRFCEEGINVIFTKINKMPVGALHSLDNNSRTAKVSKKQLEVSKERKRLVWKQIIEIKLNNQAATLDHFKLNSKYIKKYATEIELGDISNKEGQAARLYFKIMFGKDFTRDQEILVNYCLNYSYQLVRSKLAQELVSRGIHPAFGIFHRGEYNYFNLADDIIEPYRPIVDAYIREVLMDDKYTFLSPKLKDELLEIFILKITIGSSQMKLIDSIKLYVNNVLNCIFSEGDTINNYPRWLVEQV